MTASARLDDGWPHPELRRLVPESSPTPVAQQGILPLQWHRRGHPPAAPCTVQHVRLMTRPDDHPDVPATDRMAGSDLPDPGNWTARLVESIIQTLAGERPLHQLLRWLSPQVYDELAQHLSAHPPPPAAAGRVPGRAVRSVHVCRPTPDVVEASAVVRTASRSRAVALRLEGSSGRWRCTRLRVL
jgi:hypothetical protein